MTIRLIDLHDNKAVRKLLGYKVKKYLKTVRVEMAKFIEKALSRGWFDDTV
jgi:hypothetical protein